MAKGKKKCPGCGAYHGKRKHLCDCGHEFVPGAATKAKAKAEAQEEAAKKPKKPRGRKACPECEALVGLRTRKCECGHEFEIKNGASNGNGGEKDLRVARKKKSDMSPETARVLSALEHPRILTPAGNCPVKLEGHDLVSVTKWSDNMLALKDKNYAFSALKYFIKEFYVHGTAEYHFACAHLAKLEEQGVEPNFGGAEVEDVDFVEA